MAEWIKVAMSPLARRNTSIAVIGWELHDPPYHARVWKAGHGWEWIVSESKAAARIVHARVSGCKTCGGAKRSVRAYIRKKRKGGV